MTEIEIASMRADKAALLQELKTSGCEIGKDGREIKCAWHEDKTASAGIYEKDGAWHFKCHAFGCGKGGDVFDVISWNTGKTSGDVMLAMTPKNSYAPKTTQKTEIKKPPTVYSTLDKLKETVTWIASESEGRVVGTYEYTNPDTKNLDMIVFRYEDAKGKHFLQAHQMTEGFILRGPKDPWPLFNRTRLRTAEQVIVVEGEKCVIALTELGYIATTTPGGAGKATHCDLMPLAGKDCYLWPDCDATDPKTKKRSGLEHMREIANTLQGFVISTTCYWIDCDQLGLKAKGDVVDYLAQYPSATLEQKRLLIDAVLEMAEPMGPAGAVNKQVEDAIAGKRQPIGWPWTTIANATRALIPGTITMIGGAPGATKTFWIIEALCWWFDHGITIAAMFLEEDRTYHLLRALAQRAGNSEITKEEWQAKHPAEMRQILQEHKPFLNRLGARFFECPKEQITPLALTSWLRTQGSIGCRVIVIDPITMMEVGRDQWAVDLKFMNEAKIIAREFNCSIILVTHPKVAAGNKHSPLTEMAGGSAYQRFSQTVIWLLNAGETKTETFKLPHGCEEATFNRKMQIRKARNSWGEWRSIGFFFDPATFRSQERGLFTK